MTNTSGMTKDEYINSRLLEHFRYWATILYPGAAVTYLAFSILDFIIDRSHFGEFFVYRASVAAVLLTLFAIMRNRAKATVRFHRSFLAIGILASSSVLELIILKTGGFSSPHILGMGLIGIWVIGFAPVGLAFSLANAGAIFLVYSAPLLFLDHAHGMQLIVTNCALLLALLLATVGLRYFSHIHLLSELGMHYDLGRYRGRLELLVEERTAELTSTVNALQGEINERMSIKITLERIATEWRIAVDSTKESILLLDKNHSVLRANHATTVLLQKTYLEIVGKPFFDLFPCEMHRVRLDPLSLMEQSRRHEEREFLHPSMNAWIHFSSDPVFAPTGELDGAVVLIKDITELKRMQDSIRKARDDWEETFNVINDAITIHDDRYNIIQANQAAKILLNLTDGASTLRKCYAAYHGADHPPTTCASCNTLKTGESCLMELYEPHLNRHLEVKSLPRLGKDGHIIGLVHIVRDISERKQSEQEQKKLESELLQIQKMDSIGRLAGSIAHDFNNIMSAIIGFSNLALAKVDRDNPIFEDLRIINESGERAAALTKQLLAFSRKQVLEMKVVNLNTIIERMAMMIGRLIGEQISLKLDLHRPLGNIVADTGQVEQILMNLLVNARDAMPTGGHITITTMDIDAAGQQDGNAHHEQTVMLSITDTGSGMTAEVRDRIFEPFFTTKQLGKGTGLGLSTVYGIVKQHRGQITVRSEPGQGATFSIFFPKVDHEVDAAVEPRRAEPTGGTETILVVDDEPSIRTLVNHSLRPLGYHILEAPSAEAALELCERQHDAIDLLLTDVIMPGMNGPALAEEMIRRLPDIGVIFISGYTDDAIAKAGMIHSGIPFLQKPLLPNVLACTIREVLNAIAERKRETAAAAALKNIRILYADDDLALRQLVGRYLDGIGCAITFCDDGREAVELFAQKPFDLILMDMQMPRMDGISAARAIRASEAEQRRQPTPIIALTGLDTAEETRKIEDAGFTAHLTKPIQKSTLIAELARRVVTSPTPMPTADSARARMETDRFTAYVDKDLEDLVPGYLKDRSDDVKRMRDAIQTADYETVRVKGHSMKGSGGGYGFDAITELGGRIERAAKNADGDAARTALNELAEYLERVRVVYRSM